MKDERRQSVERCEVEEKRRVEKGEKRGVNYWMGQGQGPRRRGLGRIEDRIEERFSGEWGEES
jgi:hypothetical protein